ncbi:MAG: HD domain-containing phosphohydrolase [Spirochaetia bacterium]|jgi:putative two-component system response regulator
MGDKVLIVDDDPAIRKVLGIGLRGAGFEIYEAAAASEVLEVLRDSRFDPDCVMMDIRMPGMPGTELLTIVKKEHPLVPVIMLTALSELEIAVNSMKAGAFDYLSKPVRKTEVEQTVRKAIRFRKMQLENERLQRENQEYQRTLERKVEERTAQLAEAFRKLQQANIETVKVLAETIEAKDPYTRGHCSRVRLLSTRIASAMGIVKAEIDVLEYGALLHDIGKIGIPERLLNKNGRLEEEEYNVFKSHPALGASILNAVEFFRPCLPIVHHHHEWFNGQGYPDHLAGEQIDLKARIVSVADAFDAMTSSRPYRPATSTDRACEELRRGSGTQFDPRIVEAFQVSGPRLSAFRQGTNFAFSVIL